MSEKINRGEIIREMTSFLEGNDNTKYVVNVETDSKTNRAKCVIHAPDGNIIKDIPYVPFIYIKDMKTIGLQIYSGDDDYKKDRLKLYGITFKELKTGNHDRLKDGYRWKVSSSKSSKAIYDFFSDGGLNLREKLRDEDNNIVYIERGGVKQPVLKWEGLFFNVNLNEQFFISTGIRLYKGMQKYNEVHKVTFDIETTGLRYQHARVFAIGVKDNKGFKKNLFVKKLNDDDAEKRLIKDFFNTIDYIKPAIITGYNSEDFDFEFIIGRAKELKMKLDVLPTALDNTLTYKKLYRRKNTSLKVGSATEKYTSTSMWGYTIIDTIHAVKRAKAINTDIKKSNLKYIAKFSKVAKKNRVYVDGDKIGKYYHENKVFIINPEDNSYMQVPDNLQDTAENIYKLILLKENQKISEQEYNVGKIQVIKGDIEFIKFLKGDAQKYGKYTFSTGKKIIDEYLLDDLQETEDVDNIYNQASFLLAKIVPTTFHRICTMGSASVWNLLMVAWSYENDLAIPLSEDKAGFSGGLSRCYKKGLTEDVGKIDFASLYPMLQLMLDIFPKIDIDGVIKKLLIYMTTTRNIYKKLPNSDELSKEELDLLYAIGDIETFDKYKNGTITKADRKEFKIKQAPIKVLNNSIFGALGSGVAFNWSDNICAARITCSGRLALRQAVKWFQLYGLDPLLAVTDGINFGFPKTTRICIENEKEWTTDHDIPINDAWKYGDKTGVSALIEKFNEEIMTSEWMSVDNDGEFISCYNLKRINYALLEEKTDDDDNAFNKVKVVGNVIKSTTLPGYIEDFIDEGLKMILEDKGEEFINFYYDYAEKIFYKQIPLKKIASKSRIKNTIKQYLNRGNDINGRPKARQAHMELIIAERERIGREIFDEKFEELNRKDIEKSKEDYKYKEIYSLVETYMPPEPDLDTTIYYVNTGTRKSHADVKTTKKKDDKGNIISEEITIKARLIDIKDLENNPEMSGEYNVEKYLSALNTRIGSLFDGFNDDVKDNVIAEIVRTKKDKKEKIDLKMGQFTNDQLKLSSFELDNVEESMYLEEKEIIFWNRTGYNPNKIWDGYKIPKETPLKLDRYQHALDFVNDLLVKSGKKPAISINDIPEEGDLILYKDNANYSMGLYKNNNIVMVRNTVAIPKSAEEIEEDRIFEEEQKKIAEQLKLKEEMEKKLELPTYKTLDENTRLSLFNTFCDEVGFKTELSMVDVFKEIPDAEIGFSSWIDDKYSKNNEETNTYVDD